MEDEAALRQSLLPEAAPKLPPPPPPSRSSSLGPSRPPWGGDYGLGSDDRRFAFSRQHSLRQPDLRSPIPAERTRSSRPFLGRSDSSISMPPVEIDGLGQGFGDRGVAEKLTAIGMVSSLVKAVRFGNRPMKRLALMISLNVAYSTAELLIGIFTGRVGQRFKLLCFLIVRTNIMAITGFKIKVKTRIISAITIKWIPEFSSGFLKFLANLFESCLQMTA